LRFSGIVYRAHNPRWAHAADSGQGAALAGGRFNPIRTPALYTALRFETAWLEAQQAFPFKAQPLTLCAYEVDCTDILDLTDPATHAAEGVEPANLSCAWKDLASRGLTPPSWALATGLMGRGVAGIIVPSFASRATANDVNAVFWSWAAAPPHQVCVIDDFVRVTKDARSWP
jgi:RES domain-containing protein